MPTAIEWTQRPGTKGETWNPTSGCDKVSPGCGLPRPGSDDAETGRTGGCYALTMAGRLKAMGQPAYQNDGDPRTSGPGFALTLHPERLDDPLRWTKPRTVFVDSMSDLFHADVPDEFIARAFDVMGAASTHTFQLLTKRSQRMARFSNLYYDCDHGGSPSLTCAYCAPWPNVWNGVSIESDPYCFRADHLRATRCAVRFLSLEPLIGPLPSLDLTDIDWVIVGGESGKGARPMDLDWVRDIRDRCAAAEVALFVKQLGAAWSGRHHRDLKGHDMDTWPEDLRIREYPC